MEKEAPPPVRRVGTERAWRQDRDRGRGVMSGSPHDAGGLRRAPAAKGRPSEQDQPDQHSGGTYPAHNRSGVRKYIRVDRFRLTDVERGHACDTENETDRDHTGKPSHTHHVLRILRRLVHGTQPPALPCAHARNNACACDRCRRWGYATVRSTAGLPDTRDRGRGTNRTRIPRGLHHRQSWERLARAKAAGKYPKPIRCRRRARYRTPHQGEGRTCPVFRVFLLVSRPPTFFLAPAKSSRGARDPNTQSPADYR
jgi:hypothetical protein